MEDKDNKVSESSILYAIIIIFLAIAVFIFIFALMSLNSSNSKLKSQVAALSTRVTTQSNEIAGLKLSLIDPTTLVEQITALLPEAQKGDKGDTGEKGDVGPAGPAGAAGIVTQLQKISATGSTIGVNGTGSSSVACPSGWKLLSGGCQSINSVTLMTKAYPDTTNQSFNCSGNNTSGSATDQITAHAICYK